MVTRKNKRRRRCELLHERTKRRLCACGMEIICLIEDNHLPLALKRHARRKVLEFGTQDIDAIFIGGINHQNVHVQIGGKGAGHGCLARARFAGEQQIRRILFCENTLK